MNLFSNDTIDIRFLHMHLQRPNLYERSADYIWTDDHVGQQMLQLHLDPDLDSASLRHTVIDQQIRWIANAVGAGAGTDLLDIGCGPGLYCERFQRLGCTVTGIDFNRHSLEYARRRAEQLRLPITFNEQNYVQLGYVSLFDVVTLINRDFGALTTAERDTVIRAVWRSLRPGGYFVFDTLSTAYLEQRIRERRTCNTAIETGFWSQGPHVVIEHTLIYAAASAQLDRYIVISEDGNVKVFHNWLTYYEIGQVRRLVEDAGFEIVSENPFLSSETYDDPSLYVGVVAMKR